MIYVMLADGFEEIEALTAVDILRRAELPVTTVGIGGGNLIRGAHGIPVMTDTWDGEEPRFDDLEAVVLPGGMPGTLGLEHSELVSAVLDCAAKEDKVIAAICAAPSILGHRGLLAGRRATVFPGFEQELTGAEVTGDAVVWDGNILTSKGPGTATEFALALVERFAGSAEAARIKGAMQCVR